MKGLSKTMRKALGEYRKLAEKAMRRGMTVMMTSSSNHIDMTLWCNGRRTETTGAWYQEFGNDTTDARAERLQRNVEYINNFIG